MTAAVQNAPDIPSGKLDRYVQAKESQYQLDWADLVTLDLSQFDSPGGKQRLANQLKDAVHNVGFFYIINFGIPQDQIDHQFAIGKKLFELSTEEKLKYRADLENGDYNGYRPKVSEKRCNTLLEQSRYKRGHLHAQITRDCPISRCTTETYQVTSADVFYLNITGHARNVSGND